MATHVSLLFKGSEGGHAKEVTSGATGTQLGSSHQPERTKRSVGNNQVRM